MKIAANTFLILFFVCFISVFVILFTPGVGEEGFLIVPLGMLAGVFYFIFTLLMFLHAIFKPILNKGLWLVAILGTGIGPLIYFFIIFKNYTRNLENLSVIHDIDKNQNNELKN